MLLLEVVQNEVFLTGERSVALNRMKDNVECTVHKTQSHHTAQQETALHVVE
jgi:hypothetical protein